MNNQIVDKAVGGVTEHQEDRQATSIGTSCWTLAMQERSHQTPERM